ncbi:MAG: sugar-binding protein [Bacteroidales bacterium]|nr:sugar-binding protein [Bacteroidales bacterium]
MKKFNSVENFLKKIHIPYKVIFWITGLLTTAWFLIRVIPKPTRAGYPCMRAAAPIMSSFVLYILSITASAFALKKAKNHFGKAKYITATLCLLAGICMAFVVNFNDIRNTFAAPSVDKTAFPANEPMGNGKGIFPGRVVWNHNADATDENFSFNYDDKRYFWDDDVTDQEVVKSMMEQTIKTLTKKDNIQDAWNALFTYHNQRRKRGNKSYTPGEGIFIKINQGCLDWLTGTEGDINAPQTQWMKANVAATETYSAVVLELLRQLTSAGVEQEDIFISDPGDGIYKHNYDKWVAEFPNVNYLDPFGNYADITRTSEEYLHYSDEGKIMPNTKGYLYYEIIDASYMINVANLKCHVHAGVSLTAKNHFGSRTEQYTASAEGLHPSHIDVIPGYGQYRSLVDIMGNEYLGDNTMLFLVDGLFGGGSEETKRPVKYFSAPFNNDWANSIFASQDEVAIESVCQDILRSEWNGVNRHSSDNNTYENSPWWSGVDDHLHQAADPANWPTELKEGIPFHGYYPNVDGDAIGSLGTHEHWNSAEEKKYSRNLGKAYGIKLVQIEKGTVLNDDFQENDAIDKMGEKVISTSEYVAYKTVESPTFDGIGDENIWDAAPWYAIDNIWLPYDNDLNYPGVQAKEGGNKLWEGPADFTGKFKVLWSETENVLYILAEIEDDVFVDGYVSGGDYPNYDILELFVDEDKSGGKHVHNAGSELSANAFSYHLAVDAIEDDVQTIFKAMDIAGTGWVNSWNPDYKDHFAHFAMRKEGNICTYEMALKLYSDQYDTSTPTTPHSEQHRVTLTDNKEIGFAVAYCDNDDPDEMPKARDHFFGSVSLPAEENNTCWENADRYGTLILSNTYTGIETAPNDIKKEQNISVYPNPAKSYINISFKETASETIKINLYTINGTLVSTLYEGDLASSTIQLPLNGIPAGNYMCIVKMGNKTETVQLRVQ